MATTPYLIRQSYSPLTDLLHTLLRLIMPTSRPPGPGLYLPPPNQQQNNQKVTSLTHNAYFAASMKPYTIHDSRCALDHLMSQHRVPVRPPPANPPTTKHIPSYLVYRLKVYHTFHKSLPTNIGTRVAPKFLQLVSNHNCIAPTAHFQRLLTSA
jgi:hypothetical protein